MIIGEQAISNTNATTTYSQNGHSRQSELERCSLGTECVSKMLLTKSLDLVHARALRDTNPLNAGSTLVPVNHNRNRSKLH